MKQQNNFFVAIKFVFCVGLGLGAVAACGEEAVGTDRFSGQTNLQYTMLNGQCIDTQAAAGTQNTVEMRLCTEQQQRQQQHVFRASDTRRGYHVEDGQCYNFITATEKIAVHMAHCDDNVEAVMQSTNCNGRYLNEWGQEIVCWQGSCNIIDTVVYDIRSGQRIQCLGRNLGWGWN